MKKSRSTNNLLEQLDSWVAELKNLPDEQENAGRPYFRDLLAKQFIPDIKRLLADRVVRERLGQHSIPAALAAAKTFLAEAASVCKNLSAHSQSGDAATRTETIRDVTATRNAAKKLAEQLKGLPSKLVGALTIEYLSERTVNGNPPGFSAYRRSAVIRKRRSAKSPALGEILESLVNDLDEEASVRGLQVAGKRQIRGKWARFRPSVSVLSYNATKLTGTGKPDYELVAASIAVLCGADETPDADALRKQFRAKATR